MAEQTIPYHVADKDENPVITGTYVGVVYAFVVGNATVNGSDDGTMPLVKVASNADPMPSLDDGLTYSSMAHWIDQYPDLICLVPVLNDVSKPHPRRVENLIQGLVGLSMPFDAEKEVFVSSPAVVQRLKTAFSDSVSEQRRFETSDAIRCLEGAYTVIGDIPLKYKPTKGPEIDTKFAVRVLTEEAALLACLGKSQQRTPAGSPTPTGVDMSKARLNGDSDDEN